MNTQDNNSIIDGVRGYYEAAARLAVKEMPDAGRWPSFADLDADQLRAWMLAYASNIELGVRITEAMLGLGIDA